MSQPDRTALGLSFTANAETYDRRRPRYAEALFDTLVERAQLAPGARILEIGAGTGIATIELARRGFTITALEPGSAMAAIARRNLAAYPRVRVEESTFEAWSIPVASFDLVIAATSFHWLDPATRYARCAEALRPGGHLAIVEYTHAAGKTPQDDAFFEAAQSCYEQFVPGTAPGQTLPRWDEQPDTSEIEHSPWFELVSVVQTHESVPSTRSEYLDLIGTYSGSLTMAPEHRNRLFDCLGTLIDRDHGGRITKFYRHELILARRTDSVELSATQAG